MKIEFESKISRAGGKFYVTIPKPLTPMISPYAKKRVRITLEVIEAGPEAKP